MEEHVPVLRELVVMSGALTPDKVEELTRNPLVDAFGSPTWGPVTTVAYVSAPAPGLDDPSDICLGNAACEHYLTTILSRVPPCGIPALLCNMKVLLRFTWRARRAFAASFRELEDGLEGVQVAGALLTGSGPYNAMIEVVGDDEAKVMDAVMALTDVEGLELVTPLAFRVQDTHNWGSYQR